jgi:phosphohistidine phosphatase
MGKRLAKREVKPDLLLSSPALRALKTAQLMAVAVGYKRKDIVVDDRLYASNPDDLLAVIQVLDKKLNRVMHFGHNPEFADLAHRLSSEIIDMPTSAVVEFNFDTKAWSDVGEVQPAKVALDYPKK